MAILGISITLLCVWLLLILLVALLIGVTVVYHLMWKRRNVQRQGQAERGPA